MARNIQITLLCSHVGRKEGVIAAVRMSTSLQCTHGRDVMKGGGGGGSKLNVTMTLFGQK